MSIQQVYHSSDFGMFSDCVEFDRIEVRPNEKHTEWLDAYMVKHDGSEVSLISTTENNFTKQSLCNVLFARGDIEFGEMLIPSEVFMALFEQHRRLVSEVFEAKIQEELSGKKEFDPEYLMDNLDEVRNDILAKIPKYQDFQNLKQIAESVSFQKYISITTKDFITLTCKF